MSINEEISKLIDNDKNSSSNVKNLTKHIIEIEELRKNNN